MKSKLAYIRRGQRVIRMVTELHKMGYQKLRIMPYMHPLAWRLAVGPKDSFSEKNGASLKNINGGWDDVPIFSSACNYFEWTDAETDNARALAEKFVTRFSEVASRGLGRDWAYAGWLSELLGELEGGDFLPVVEWEYMKGTPDQLRFVPIWSFPSGSNNIQCDEGEYLSEPADGARQFPLPPAILKLDKATPHWSEDRYWTDAQMEYCRLRDSGQSEISLNIAAIERDIYDASSPAYRLMDAMCSVKEHDGHEGFKGAPRLLLSVLPLLSNMGALDSE
jgi:hypothetical protein